MDVILALLQLVVKQNLRLVPLLEGRNAVAGSRAQDVLRRQEKFLKNSITIRIKQLQVSADSAQCFFLCSIFFIFTHCIMKQTIKHFKHK
jgi:hypothetical protein